MVAYAALAIFLGTYVLISLRRLAHIPIERPAVALLGASLMILARVLTPQEALAAIDLNTLLLLIGMMLVVVVLEATGLFARAALYVVEHSKTQTQLLVGLGITTALLSALVLNDAVVLFFTPIIIHAARHLHVHPVKYLVVEAITANIGSLATQVGNPQNAYIGLQSGIPFARYALFMAPLAALCLALALGLVVWIYRRDLRQPLATRSVSAVEREAAITQPRLLAFGLTMVALLFVGFLASRTVALPIPLLALAAGSVMIFFAPVLGKTSPRVLFRRVDWSIILLFVGLFIVLKGVAVSGTLDALFDALERLSRGAIHQVWGLGLLASIISNLISNVPATLLLSPLVAETGSETLWYALAASTTMAGNATILGAAANIIVAERAEEEGVPITFWDFFRVGFPVTVLTLTVAFLALSALAPRL